LSAQPRPALSDLIADGWAPMRLGAFPTLIGPILRKYEGGRLTFCFRVENKHDNTQGRAHGGMIMAFCDEAMGHAAAETRPQDSLMTIGFECQFIGAALPGDVVTIETEVVRNTASLTFLRAICTAGDRPIASCSGIWKAARRKLPAVEA